VRAVALLGPSATEAHARQFELPGVNLFSGNELDPTDEPAAALVFGGDGTLHRHLAVLSQKQIPSLIVPMGSANDFAQSIGVATVERALKAWQRFVSSGDNIRSIDLGTIQPLDSVAQSEHAATEPWSGESFETLHFVPSGPRRDLPQLGPRIMQSQLRRAVEAEREIAREVLFAGIAGTGLDAAVNRRTITQPRWLRAHGGYVFALLQALGRFEPPRMKITAEVEGEWRTVADEPGMLIAAGNGPQYGSGMRVTHQAEMDDGLLDVCFVRRVARLRLLRLFPVVFRGRHIGMEEVEYVRTIRVRIETNPVSEVFADGEPVCATPVEIGVKREGLRVVV
jgi:diacylglycerol kinase (ATP)